MFFDTHRDQFIVGYFGGHAISNALDQLLDVAKDCLGSKEDRDIVFVLVGEGQEKARLIKRTETEHIHNTYFLPPVNKRAVPDLLAHFDCSYMTGKASPLYRFGLSLNKMYDSMMAGIPIICVFDAPETLVETYQCGIQCSPDHIDSVVEAIRTIQTMSEMEKREMGMNGKKAILQNFTYHRLARDFINKITA